MRIVLSLIFLLSAVLPVQAADLCGNTRPVATVVEDKILSAIDTLTPALFHDPILTIRFHTSRANELYQNAVNRVNSNPGEAIWLAVRAQNHLTLIEANIREVKNPGDVPYNDIWRSFRITQKAQDTLHTNLPKACRPTISQLQSFESGTVTTIKKLYYESLLP